MNKAVRGRPARDPESVKKLRPFRASDAEWEAWKKRAAEEETTVAEWLRGLATKAIKRGSRKS